MNTQSMVALLLQTQYQNLNSQIKNDLQYYTLLHNVFKNNSSIFIPLWIFLFLFQI